MSNNITIRMPDAERALLADLADRVAEDIGIEVSATDLIKIAIKRLPKTASELFRPPELPR